jgi:hypothetical protein
LIKNTFSIYIYFKLINLTLVVFSLSLQSAFHALAVIIPKVEPVAAFGALVIGGAQITVSWTSAASLVAGFDIEANVALTAASLSVAHLAISCTVVTVIIIA